MIIRTSIDIAFRRMMAGIVTVCLVGMALPAPGARAARAHPDIPVLAAEPEAKPAADHFLRDAIPATSFAAAQPDTTDDDFVLPEEKSKKQLAKEIAVWTIAVALVAFFIVKVFIEEDEEPVDEGGNGKDVPPPQ